MPWDDDAFEILDRNTPPDMRESLRGEIEHFARSRGETRVTLDTFLALEELLHGS